MSHEPYLAIENNGRRLWTARNVRDWEDVLKKTANMSPVRTLRKYGKSAMLFDWIADKILPDV